MFSLIEPIESIVDRLSLYRFACLDMGSKSIKNMPVRQRTLPYPPRPANRLVNIAAKMPRYALLTTEIVGPGGLI
jgi:hypothetical protein